MNPMQRAQLAKSARALLAAGNPPESVANVLGLSVQELMQLQKAPTDESGKAAPGSGPSSSEARVQPIAFPCELVYRESPSTRILSFAIGIFLIAGMAWFWRWTDTLAGGRGRGGVPVVLWFVAGPVGAWFMLRTRIAFVLGTQRVSARGAVLTDSLDYSEIASIDCAKEVQHGRGGPFPGHRLKFTPKNLLGSAVSVFIAEGTLSHDMIVRLEQLAATLGMAGHPFEDLRRGHAQRS